MVGDNCNPKWPHLTMSVKCKQYYLLEDYWRCQDSIAITLSSSAFCDKVVVIEHLRVRERSFCLLFNFNFNNLFMSAIFLEFLINLV